MGVSILPSERTPWDVIGRDAGRALQQVLPGAVQQGFQRQQGLNAIDQLQDALGKAGGDINQILPALARAYTLNPALERSGLGQQYLQQSRVGQAYGMPPQGSAQPKQGILTSQQNAPIQGQSEQTQPKQTAFATPGPFNVMTKDEMDAESRRFAQVTGDPNNYNVRFNQLQAQNDAATAQRNALEQAALKADVKPGDLPRFMVVNSHLDPRNPSEWAQNAIRNFSDVKNNDNALRRAFIPGVNNALMGTNREEALKRLEGPVQDNAKRGLEQEDRQYLASEYVTPTEIELLYHPQTPKLEKAIESFPKGIFPAQKKASWGDIGQFFKGKLPTSKTTPFVSYEEALEKDPQGLKVMQDRLANFFLKNVDEQTSLLGIRDKLWDKKDYDWRQIAPAIRQAEEMGLKLEPFQIRELATLQTQAPIQSLPDLFKDLARIPAVMRGAK